MANEPMTNEPDYGEPWDDENHYGHITTRDADIVIYGNRVEGLAKQRIISCVNACRGIPDPEKVVPLLVEAVLHLHAHTAHHHADNCSVIQAAIAVLQPKREG